MRCVAVRKRGSVHPCDHEALPGMEWCGQHARMKNPPTRWLDARASHVPNAIRIQAVFRGWRVRRRLALAGPGVLKRSLCVNEEDVVTLDEMKKIPVEDYFGWEEHGKVWGFHVLTLLQMLRGSLHPTNPYTKGDIPREARKRLRRVMYDRVRQRKNLSHSPAIASEALVIQQTNLCQNLEENGFEDFHPEMWNALSRMDTFAFLDRLSQILRGWAMEPPYRAWREAYAGWVRQVARDNVHQTPWVLRWATARICNVLFAREVQPYEIAFHIVSAYTQVS